MFTEWIVSSSELARHLFIGCPSRGHEEDVEAGEATDGEEDQADDAHDDHGHDGGGLRQTLLVVEHMDETQHEDTDHVKGQADQEHEEVSVVSPPDAVVDPRTMMIKYLNTVVAHTAVTTSWRSVELTRYTPLHPHLATKYFTY